MKQQSPIRPTDDGARQLARDLIDTARFAALAVTDPDTSTPSISRIALVTDPDGAPLTLISQLSAHTRHLMADPRCALLVGEPGAKGDPLTHPRLSLQCTATFIPHDDPRRAALRAHYLTQYPKAQLYIDFADFLFARFDVTSAALNGGFGKAFHLTPEDLRPCLR